MRREVLFGPLRLGLGRRSGKPIGSVEKLEQCVYRREGG